MSNIEIPNLPLAIGLDGNEQFEIVQAGTSKRTTIAAFSRATGGSVVSVNASGGTTGLTFSGGPITVSGTLTLSGTLAVANGGTGVTTATGTGSVVRADSAGPLTNMVVTSGLFNNVTIGGITPSSGRFTQLTATISMGFTTGAGGAIAQTTNRTTGVTLNKACGSITLVSAAGTTAWQTFTVTNSQVAINDTVIVVQRSGTDKYLCPVTAVAAGSFQVTFATTGGTTVEQPVLNFTVIKAVVA